MEPLAGKPSLLRNILVRVLLFGVAILLLRFAYVVTVTGESCDSGDFCFFSIPASINIAGGFLRIDASAVVVDAVESSSSSSLRDLWTTNDWHKTVDFYSAVFQDLIAEGYLSPHSKALCIETPTGQEVFALKEIGVHDAIGISKKKAPPLVVSGQAVRQPFDDNTFDFEFSRVGTLDRSTRPLEFASEVGRTLKPQGFFVVHTASANDTYSFNSFLALFSGCRMVRSRDIAGPDSSMPSIREIVLKKETEILGHGKKNSDGSEVDRCTVQGYKQDLVRKAEPLITEEPLKPWITLKRNIKSIQYLTSLADISFKPRYVYIDVGARSYGSSIGSWFKKQYPKQNRKFEIYAIEADKTFHEEYRKKKGVNLLPYAAWVRNETLLFEINQDPGDNAEAKGRGMGRIHPVRSPTSLVGDLDKIQGFDFATWLKNTVSVSDFVVMKMDIEGTEFDLIPRLFETGTICLIDEIFLECHYNRWQKCCPGERTPKYRKTYGQCLLLFSSLRESGVVVHQWW